MQAFRFWPDALADPLSPAMVFDIGGTWFRSAHFSPGLPLAQVQHHPALSFHSDRQASAASLKEGLLAYLVGTALAQGARRCGVSLGAAMDARSGQVYGSGPLWGSDCGGLDLPGELARRTPGVRWHVANDVTCALLHYASQLAPQSPPLRKVMLITVSTGIACRTLDLRTGEVPVDSFGLQGEIGHLPVAPAQWAPRRTLDLCCDCGGRNHLAAFSSGRGLRNLHRALRQHGHPLWAGSLLGRLRAAGVEHEAALADALDAHDPYALTLLRLGTRAMADTLRCALALDPELDRIVLTGGVSTHLGQHYLDALATHFDEAGLYLTSKFDPGYIMNRIVIAPPGTADGLYGAGLQMKTAAREWTS
ncbi:ROK family protein [Pseudomonas sp. RIT-To-2]|uniref:ROK family protein n=1 Tax=Pseudomonas sp. RIT-To-2 TaxID=3462541 RepID=UPI002413A6EC